LEKSPYFPREWQQRQQLKQAGQLLQHARSTVPYYHDKIPRDCFLPELSHEAWCQLPIATRKDIQQAGETLVSQQLPASHGQLKRISTSGSTGMPVVCYGTELTHLLWMASSLMEHFWHRRDVSGKHLTIRPGDHLPMHHPLQRATWAPPVQTAPSLVLNVQTDIRLQLQILLQEKPAYLLSLPSNLKALAELCREQAILLPELKGVRSYGEVLTPEIRKYCEATWGVKMTDVYSAQEIGNMAFQCPEHGRLHVFSDGVVLEVLRDDGTPCQPGETGQVVVTTLANYGCPLIRYAIGDYAELGEDCSCGRNTPVLNRIYGRQRNMLHIPGGGRIWPSFSVGKWVGDLPISQFQFVQKSLECIEAHLVTDRPLTAREEEQFNIALFKRLGHQFRIDLKYREEIPRSKSGKYEDFISEVL
jgi:phenylacetate-CoA ligase